MKFLYSDTQDYVDPGYDFINDRNAPGRKRYWDDRYAHELMDPPPYDGLLISMSGIKAIPGVSVGSARYSLPEEQRFLRDGARKFLRFGGARFQNRMLMGDCGAFAYAELDRPAYTPEEVMDFYLDAGFTHGCSPDHIIFDFLPSNPPREEVSQAISERYDITLENAREFRRLSRDEGDRFEPMGPVQGWSPQSMADAANHLEQMGYRYLAVGGLVPLRVDAIHLCLQAIRGAIKPSTKLHLLGFAKAEQIDQFLKYDIESFDSTSPLIRAFKDARANYYSEAKEGGLQYFSAIRIPQAIENPRLMKSIKSGALSAEELQTKESSALRAIRSFDRGEADVEETLDVLLEYQECLRIGNGDPVEKRQQESVKSRALMRATLEAKPWKECSCAVCRDVGVEVIIFRASNRNKRRGFHNLGVYYRHLQRTISGN